LTCSRNPRSESRRKSRTTAKAFQRIRATADPDWRLSACSDPSRHNNSLRAPPGAGLQRQLLDRVNPFSYQAAAKCGRWSAKARGSKRWRTPHYPASDRAVLRKHAIGRASGTIEHRKVRSPMIRRGQQGGGCPACQERFTIGTQTVARKPQARLPISRPKPARRTVRTQPARSRCPRRHRARLSARAGVQLRL
jgi:hypothetical protein